MVEPQWVESVDGSLTLIELDIDAGMYIAPYVHSCINIKHNLCEAAIQTQPIWRGGMRNNGGEALPALF